MTTTIRRLGWATPALFALTLVGCEPVAPTTPATPTTATAPTAPTTPTEPTTPTAPPEIKAMPVDPGKADEPKKDGAAAAPAKLSDAELAEIKKLPADEQVAAIAQVTCPVSGDHLGEMGAPIKQTIGDKSFYICCAGCEKMVKNKPDEVLAKLKK